MGSSTTIDMDRNGNNIEFIQIKPAKHESLDSPANHDPMQHSCQSLLSFLERDGGLNLFMNYCAKEFCLENVLAFIELTQFESYCKKQKKYISQQQKLRKKSAKK